MILSADKNREAILRDLRTRGVEFRLCPDRGMQWRDVRGMLSENERIALDVCRESLMQHLRHEAKLCRECDGTRTPNTPYCRECLWARVGDFYYKNGGKVRLIKSTEPEPETEAVSGFLGEEK